MNRMVLDRWRTPLVSIQEIPLTDHCESVTAARLYEDHLDTVYRYVAWRVRRRQDAEDVTAEVFAAAFAGLGKYRGQATPQAWLLGIARRKVIDAIRRQTRRRETLEAEMGSDLPPQAGSDSERDPAAALDQDEAARQIRQLVDGLNPDQREALLLQYVEGLSIAEIAVVMGRSAGAINSLLQRARASVFRAGQPFFLGSDEREGVSR
jgi:RNA polymerase sigma-70 factor (ECF subfamily)